uniref:DNA pilot protein n=1 Tax=Dulem virus 169 TaxID=3145646 RepID=A0AAU8AZN4_9VIRU
MATVLRPTTVGRYKVGVGKVGSSSLGSRNFAGSNMSGVRGNVYSPSSGSDGSSGSGSSAGAASSVAGLSGVDLGDYSDYIRQGLDLAANNTAQSQAFAREQMDFQTAANDKAMSFSAQQAALNREWQERLSNTAHQREVDDLIKAGLNPILSANAGAYTGSGATASGVTSSGAMGNVDTTVNGLVGQLISAGIQSAANRSVAKVYTDASKYQADMQYAAAKLASETSIYNNNNTNSANKAISNINAGATIKAANAHASASRYAADQSYNASIYGSDTSRQNTKDTNATSKENTSTAGYYSNYNSPFGFFKNLGIDIGNTLYDMVH